MVSETIPVADNVVRADFSVPAPPVDDEIVISADDVDYERDTPKPVSAAMLNEIGEGPTIRTMELYQTSLKVGRPVTAKVRIVNLTDRSIIGTLPSALQNKINKLFFAPSTASQRGNRNRREDDPEEQQKRVIHVARTYGCAGFVEPRLVENKEDVKDPERETWVGNIPLHDLQEYVRICEGDANLAERRLERFPE